MRPWIWYGIPVALNLIGWLVSVFLTGYCCWDAKARIFYFSLPYWALAVWVLWRVNRPGTMGDLLFFAFGQIAIVNLMEIAFEWLVLKRANPNSLIHRW